MVAQGTQGQCHGGIIGTQCFEGNLAVKHILVQIQSKATDEALLRSTSLAGLVACYLRVASATFHWGGWLARSPAPALNVAQWPSAHLWH